MALMSSDWLIGLMALLLGAVVGGFIVRLFGADSGREKALNEELEQTKKEFSSYKSEVEAHFRETAAAVNAMTESYRVVYDRLRDGATRLCGEGGQLPDLKAAPLLEAASAEPVSDSTETPPEPTAATAEAPDEDQSPLNMEDTEAQSAAESEASESELAAAEEGAPQGEPRAPLDYAADSDDEEREKTLH